MGNGSTQPSSALGEFVTASTTPCSTLANHVVHPYAPRCRFLSGPAESELKEEKTRHAAVFQLQRPNKGVALDRAGMRVFRDITFLAAGPASERNRSAMVRVHRRLAKRGFGLLVHDGYRPWSVTKMFWEATPANLRIFVADPQQGSRHNRGCAVDLTLYDRATGKPIDMVGGYDEMSDRSYPDYPGGTSLQRWHRDLLRREMEAEGFAVYEAEWWHFDYKDWRKYPIGNVTFEEIGKGG